MGGGGAWVERTTCRVAWVERTTCGGGGVGRADDLWGGGRG